MQERGPRREGGETPARPGRAELFAILVPALLFMAVLGLLMSSNAMYGLTYDEPIYQSKALQALEWLSLAVTAPSLAVSPEAIERYWKATDQHPGFYKLLVAASAVTLGRLVPPGEATRTGTNLLCALCCVVLYLFVSRLWGRAAGLYAVGALLAMPHVFAACHLAALDAPIMALTLIVLVASRRAAVLADGRPRPSDRRAWGLAVLAAVLWGLALGTKLNAFFLPFVVFPWVFVFARRAFWRLGLCYLVLGPLTFLATWPWLWHDTAARFSEYFRFHLRHWEIGVTYFGENTTLAPWHYPLVMTLITVPPVTLVLALAGGGKWLAMVRRWAADRRRAAPAAHGGAAFGALTLVIWALVVNYVPSCLPSTPKYNGVRLFLPVFPLLAIVAAVGFRTCMDALVTAARSLSQAPELRWRVMALGLFVSLLWPLHDTARFTPFHLSYYNAFIGGLSGAVRAGMEPTYWGDTYRSASLWLAQHAEEGSTIWVEPPGFESTVRLFELGPLRPDLRFSAGPEAILDADYAVTQNKPTEFTDVTRRLIATRRPVYTDGVDGVPLVYVFKMR